MATPHTHAIVDVEALVAGRSEIPLREFAAHVMGVHHLTAWERYRRGTLGVTVTQAVPPCGTRRGSALMVPVGEVRRYVETHGIGVRATTTRVALPAPPPGRRWVWSEASRTVTAVEA